MAVLGVEVAKAEVVGHVVVVGVGVVVAEVVEAVEVGFGVDEGYVVEYVGGAVAGAAEVNGVVECVGVECVEERADVGELVEVDVVAE